MFEKFFGRSASEERTEPGDYLKHPKEMLKLKNGPAKNALVRTYIEYCIKEKRGMVDLAFVKALPSVDEQKDALLKIAGVRDLNQAELGILSSRIPEYQAIRKAAKSTGWFSRRKRNVAAGVLRVASLVTPAAGIGTEAAYAQQTRTTIPGEMVADNSKDSEEESSSSYRWAKFMDELENIESKEDKEKWEGVNKTNFLVALDNLHRQYRDWSDSVEDIKKELSKGSSADNRRLESIKNGMSRFAREVYERIGSDSPLRKESLKISEELSRIDSGKVNQFHSRISIWLEGIRQTVIKYTAEYANAKPGSNETVVKITVGSGSRNDSGARTAEGSAGTKGLNSTRERENSPAQPEINPNARIQEAAKWNDFDNLFPQILRRWLDPYVRKENDPTLGIKGSEMRLGRTYREFKKSYIEYTGVTESVRDFLSSKKKPGSSITAQELENANNALTDTANDTLRKLEDLRSAFMFLYQQSVEGGASRDELAEILRSFNAWINPMGEEIRRTAGENSDTLRDIYNQVNPPAKQEPAERRSGQPGGQSGAWTTSGPRDAYGQTGEGERGQQSSDRSEARIISLSGQNELSETDLAKLPKDQQLLYLRNRKTFLDRKVQATKKHINRKKKDQATKKSREEKTNREIPKVKKGIESRKKELDKLGKQL